MKVKKYLFFENVFTSRSLHFTKLLPNKQGRRKVKNLGGEYLALSNGHNLPHDWNRVTPLTKNGGDQSHVPICSGGSDQDHRVVFQCYTEESQKKVGSCWKKDEISRLKLVFSIVFSYVCSFKPVRTCSRRWSSFRSFC